MKDMHLADYYFLRQKGTDNFAKGSRSYSFGNGEGMLRNNPRTPPKLYSLGHAKSQARTKLKYGIELEIVPVDLIMYDAISID